MTLGTSRQAPRSGSPRPRGTRRRPSRSLAALLAWSLVAALALVLGQPVVAPISMDPAQASTATSTNGDLTVNYTVSPTSLPAGGGTVTYTYTVTNNAKVVYYSSVVQNSFGAKISDSACTNMTVVSGSQTIQPGATTTYSCTTTLTQSTLSTVNVHFAKGGTSPTQYTDVSAQVYVPVATTSTSPMVAINCQVPKVWVATTLDANGNTVSSAGTYSTTLTQQFQTATSSQFQPINLNATSGWSYNALAYRSADSFLYGIVNNDLQATTHNGATGDLLQIDANGQIKDLGNISTWTFQNSTISGVTGTTAKTNWTSDINGGINSGVFGSDGYYYVSNASTSGTSFIYRLDIVNKTVQQITTVAARSNDITYKDGYLWGVQNGAATMYRINVSTGAVQTFAMPSGWTNATYGAAWTYGNGNLGFDNNGTGTVVQLQVTNSTGATPTFTVVSTGPGRASYNNDGASCTNTTDVDLGIQKIAPANVLPSGAVTFTLRVTNYGPGYSSGGVVSDVIPTGYTAITVPSSCKLSGNTVTCTTGQLNPNDSYDILLTATAPSTTGCLTNTATVTGNEADSVSSNNTGSAQTCVNNAKIDVGKVANSTVASGPDASGNYTVSYKVTVANTGTSSGTYTQISDAPNFSPGTTISQVTWAGGPAGAAATTVTAAADGSYPVGTSAAKTLAAGATDTYTVTFTYKQAPTSTNKLVDCGAAGSQGGTGLFNQVSLPEENNDVNSNSACANPVPAIQVVKTVVASGQTGPGTADTLTVTSGDKVDFYYQVSLPTGYTEPLKPVTLADDKCSNPALVSGDTNSDSTLNVGETWLYKCTQAITGSTAITNTATATGTGTVTAKSVTATDTATVTPQSPSINVAKTAGSVSAVDANGNFTVTYKLTVTNSGPVAGSYGPLTDTPAFASNLEPSGASWTGQASGSASTAGPYTIGAAATAIAAGATQTYNLSIVLHYTDTTQAVACGGANTGLYNAVSLPAGQEQGVTTDNNACVAPPAPPKQGLTLAKTVKSVTDKNGNGFNDPGDTIQYTFQVTNTGDTTLAPVTITDSMLNLSAWQCAATLAPGASATCDAPAAYTITSADGTAGNVHNMATATGKPPYTGAITTPQATVDTPLAPVSQAVVTKTDASNGATLKGATFSLYTATASTWSGGKPAPAATVCSTAAASGTASQTGLTTGSSGQVTLSGLKLATYDYTNYKTQTSGSYTVYCLVETKAPTGYNLLAQPVTFTVNDAAAATQVAVKDAPTNLANALPTAGGRGGRGAGLAGLAILAVLVGAAIHRRRKGVQA